MRQSKIVADSLSNDEIYRVVRMSMSPTIQYEVTTAITMMNVLATDYFIPIIDAACVLVKRNKNKKFCYFYPQTKGVDLCAIFAETRKKVG